MGPNDEAAPKNQLTYKEIKQEIKKVMHLNEEHSTLQQTLVVSLNQGIVISRAGSMHDEIIKTNTVFKGARGSVVG
jgi:hypothetical protein